MDPLTNQVPTAEKKSFGPLIGIIVIIIVLLGGAAYFFWSNQASVPAEKETEEIAPVTTNDDVDSIESELNAIGTTSEGFEDIEQSL